jgi:uncharacterized protein (DUF1800 family)
METAAFIALNRFGLGRRAGSPLPENPRQWLRAQLEGPDTSQFPGLPDTPAALAIVNDQLSLKRLQKEQAASQAASPGAKPDASMVPHPVADIGKREAHALLAQAVLTEAPFRERLVWFWANHFTVANKTLVTGATSGAYVREAIRPFVTGKFSEMLLAVMRHPAMINYLNQERSAGPDSQAGERRHLGLNENLARESLELHTVSPASGYTQADVTNYAKILTGWSVELKQEPVGFRFRPVLHEPGEINVMGHAWPDGEQGGVAILQWLGTHPATYRHLAQKLAIHFIADEPRPSDVARIQAALADSSGDLGAAAASVIDMPSAWAPFQKLRPPQEWVIAALRAVGADPEKFPNLPGICGGLGQPLFQAPFPIGWPDRAADWAGPEAMLQRVDYAYGLAARFPETDPAQLGHNTLGALLSAETLGQIKSAGSRRDGLTLLLSSPEFMRR